MSFRGSVARLTSTSKPIPPRGGIPKQRTPKLLRYFLRLLVFPFMLLDLFVQRIIHRLYPPPYRVKGACLKRGNCCYYIFMEWPPIMDKWRWFSRFWDWWYTDINGFYFRDFDMENEDGRVARVMGCRYLNDSGLCSQYFWRPAICRQWPRIEYSCLPHLLKGCGYHIELYADHKQDLDLHPNKPKDENEPQSKNNTKASKLDHK